MFSSGALRKMVRLGLFLFMGAFIPGFAGPLVLMVSLAGRNVWRNADGPLSSLTGRGWDGPPGLALSSTNGSQDLVIEDLGAVASIPKLVVAGDNDQLVTYQMSSAVAESLGAWHISVGKDWGLSGFGHMIPIENGSEEILDACLDWF